MAGRLVIALGCRRSLAGHGVGLSTRGASLGLQTSLALQTRGSGLRLRAGRGSGLGLRTGRGSGLGLRNDGRSGLRLNARVTTSLCASEERRGRNRRLLNGGGVDIAVLKACGTRLGWIGVAEAKCGSDRGWRGGAEGGGRRDVVREGSGALDGHIVGRDLSGDRVHHGVELLLLCR